MPNEPVVFLNGEFVPFAQAKIPFYDLGIVSGVTFTEMIRTFNGKLFRAEDHLSRLMHSLQTAQIELPQSPKVLLSQIEELAQRNRALIGGNAELGVVVFVTAGAHYLYAAAAGPFEPTVCIHSFSLPFEKYRAFFTDGARVAIPATRHIPSASIDATTKHRSRLHWRAATRQAHEIDPSAAPLLLDADGFITETSTANFMIVRGESLIIPKPENILHGISLQTTMEIAAKMGMAILRRDITKNDVLRADEAWITSTPFCIAPCTHIDGQPIGAGIPSARWKKVLLAWSEMVGKDIYAEICGANAACHFDQKNLR